MLIPILKVCQITLNLLYGYMYYVPSRLRGWASFLGRQKAGQP